MIETKDFLPLSRAHSKNLSEAISSMKNSKSPVIIDNTNIKMNESKAYVKAALEMGYSESNIQFVDVGTGGITAEELSLRNTHGVPLEKIKEMMASHSGQGEITLNKVLESKDFYKLKPSSGVSFSAIVLDVNSHNALISNQYPFPIPKDWKIFAHHMTITLGELKDKTSLGETVTLKVNKVGISDMAMAVAVEGFRSINEIPHVTLAVSPEGKPAMSKEITKWQDIKSFNISGVVTEIKIKTI